MGNDKFDAMTCELIKLAYASRQSQNKTKSHDGTQQKTTSETTPDQSKELPKNQGKLLLDATVADQMIVYPTDLGLISNSRQESERIIDIICDA